MGRSQGLPQPRARLRNSLFARISLVYFFLVLGAGAFSGWLWYVITTRFNDYSIQFLNWSIAEQYARELADVLEQPLQPEQVSQRMHELMELNPGVDIFIVGKDGHVYFSYNTIVSSSIDTAPIERFLAEHEQRHQPIRILNLRSAPGSQLEYTVFSAARVNVAGMPGYVLVTLRSQLYWKVYRVFGEYNILILGQMALAVVFVAIGLLGFLIFWIMTRRFRALTAVVSKFGHGSYDERAAVASNDEVGQLGRAFNEMADTIKRSVRALEDNDRLRRNLVANVSHDLRSPLTSIQGFLQMLHLQHSEKLDEDGRQFVRLIGKSTAQLKTLADSLFELAKLEAKESAPAFETMHVEEFAADMVLKFRPQAEEKNISLTLEEPSELPAVLADPIFLDRLFSNLLDNAIRHTPQGGEVAISFGRVPGRVLVRISDTGEGIPEDALKHVFDQFYQVGPGSKTSGGSGLGLAIAKKIVEAHGGAITVESNVAKGTTFQFDLPEAGEAASSVQQPPSGS